MPKAFPKDFRKDVIRVFRDSDASMAQVAKDFGISPFYGHLFDGDHWNISGWRFPARAC